MSRLSSPRRASDSAQRTPRSRRVLTAVALVGVTGGVLGASLAASPMAHSEPAGKVWVCKYVSTPGEKERFSHLINVSWNSIKADDKPTEAAVGYTFADAQGKSVVIQVGGGEPQVNGECSTGPR